MSAAELLPLFWVILMGLGLRSLDNQTSEGLEGSL